MRQREKRFKVGRQSEGPGVSMCSGTTPAPSISKPINVWVGCSADIHVIVKIESADSIPNLHSIISASDGAMVSHGDLGAELPIEDVPLLQEEMIRRCHGMEKPVIVAMNILESMINHPTPTRAEVSDIAIAVREGADAIMLSGETAHGKEPSFGHMKS